jgi:sodium-dependent dicarboxylate transporter 2/3/5
MKKSQIAGVIIAILILVGMHFIPEAPGLTIQGIKTLGILLALIVLLVTEPIPIGVTCILGIAFMVAFRAVDTVAQALVGYTNQIMLFVVVSFGISYAITKVPLSRRLLKVLIRIFGSKINLILLSFMLSAAVLSSIMSNVATTAVFISVVLNFLTIYTDPEEKKRSGKAFMIGLPISAMIGGIITPAGFSLILLIMDFLDKQAGISITFVEWMLLGTPIAVTTLFFAWFLICKVFKPVEVGKERVEEYVANLGVEDKMSFKEKYVLTVVVIMFTLWVLSSWYPRFNIGVVSAIGFGFMFMPKVEILTWDEFVGTVSWAAYFLVGTMLSLGTALSASGVSVWLVSNIFPATLDLPVPIIAFVLSILVFILLVPIPLGPVLITMLMAPFLVLAGAYGISPAIPLVLLVMVCSNCYILPLDTVPLLTYMTGYYKMSDMPKVSIAIQLFMAVAIGIWVPIGLKILGIG